MKEFTLYIRNKKDAKKSLSEEKHLEFNKQYEIYITKLKSENKLIAAHSISREGVILKKLDFGWVQNDINAFAETQVGYYHIYADNLEDAIKIAKENPEFSFVQSATIEVRPIKVKETEIGFVYPINQSVKA